MAIILRTRGIDGVLSRDVYSFPDDAVISIVDHKLRTTERCVEVVYNGGRTSYEFPISVDAVFEFSRWE